MVDSSLHSAALSRSPQLASRVAPLLLFFSGIALLVPVWLTLRGPESHAAVRFLGAAPTALLALSCVAVATSWFFRGSPSRTITVAAVAVVVLALPLSGILGIAQGAAPAGAHPAGGLAGQRVAATFTRVVGATTALALLGLLSGVTAVLAWRIATNRRGAPAGDAAVVLGAMMAARGAGSLKDALPEVEIPAPGEDVGTPKSLAAGELFGHDAELAVVPDSPIADDDGDFGSLMIAAEEVVEEPPPRRRILADLVTDEELEDAEPTINLETPIAPEAAPRRRAPRIRRTAEPTAAAIFAAAPHIEAEEAAHAAPALTLFDLAEPVVVIGEPEQIEAARKDAADAFGAGVVERPRTPAAATVTTTEADAPPATPVATPRVESAADAEAAALAEAFADSDHDTETGAAPAAVVVDADEDAATAHAAALLDDDGVDEALALAGDDAAGDDPMAEAVSMTAAADDPEVDVEDDEAPLFRDALANDVATASGAGTPDAPAAPRPPRRPRATRTPRREAAAEEAEGTTEPPALEFAAATAPAAVDDVPARTTGTPEAAGNDATPIADLLTRAKEVVIAEDRCSASLLQRELGIRFVEAAALIEHMHRDGIVGPYQPNGMREVLIGRGRAAAGA